MKWEMEFSKLSGNTGHEWGKKEEIIKKAKKLDPKKARNTKF